MACCTPGLAQDPVLVPPLPRLAPAEPVEPGTELERLRDATAPAAPAPAPPDQADPSDAAVASGGVRTIPEEYRPAMVEALAETAGVLEAQEIGVALGQMDIEVLRIIARMSPEQIDALTLLILSQSPEGGRFDPAALPGAVSQEDARWIGDWFSQPAAAGNGADGQPAEAEPWILRETAEGKVVIAHTGDPLSQLEVETGMMLGHFGRVTRIMRLPDAVQIETSGGTILTGPREGAIATAAVAPAPAARPEEPPSAARLLPKPRPAPPAPPASPAAAPERAPEPARSAAPVASAPVPEAGGTATGVLIQAGSFTVPGNADAAAGILAERGLAATVREPTKNTPFFRLLVGPVARAETGAALGALADAGFADSFVLPSPVPLTVNE